MKKPMFVSLLSVGAAALLPTIALPTAASAQTVAPKVLVQLGVEQPQSKDARNATSSTGFLVSAGYLLPSTAMNKSGGMEHSLSVDGLFMRSSGHGRSLQSYGVFLSDRITMTAAKTSMTHFYYGGAVGIAQSRYHFNTTVVNNGTGGNTGEAGVGTTPTSTSSSLSKSGLAGRLMLGAQLPQGLTVEFAYNLMPKIKSGGASLTTSTISLSVGKTF